MATSFRLCSAKETEVFPWALCVRESAGARAKISRLEYEIFWAKNRFLAPKIVFWPQKSSKYDVFFAPKRVKLVPIIFLKPKIVKNWQFSAPKFLKLHRRIFMEFGQEIISMHLNLCHELCWCHKLYHKMYCCYESLTRGGIMWDGLACWMGSFLIIFNSGLTKPSWLCKCA